VQSTSAGSVHSDGTVQYIPKVKRSLSTANENITRGLTPERVQWTRVCVCVGGEEVTSIFEAPLIKIQFPGIQKLVEHRKL